jgi:DNA invertase Pin-like site-specific DNA recombinase
VGCVAAQPVDAGFVSFLGELNRTRSALGASVPHRHNDASGYALLQMLGMFSKLERSLTIERIKTRRKASG